MALALTDLVLIQRGSTPYKTSAQSLKDFVAPIATASATGVVKPGTNITIAADGTISSNLPGALVYKGVLAATGTPSVATAPAGPSAPAAPAAGDVWVVNAAGSLGATWGNVAGVAVVPRDMIIRDATGWDVIGQASGGVASITGTAPVKVAGTTVVPVLSVDVAVASTAGVGGSSGLMTAGQAEQMTKMGTVTGVTGTAPIQVKTGTITPVISIDAATNTATGALKVATAAEVGALYSATAVATAGEADKAITLLAAQNRLMPYDISTLKDLP